MPLRFALLPAFLCLTLLATQAAGDPPRIDRYGDPLPDGAVFRIGTTRLRHNPCFPPFAAVLPSPDGKVVFSSSHDDSCVCMWDAATGRRVRQISTDDFGFNFALSANGSLLAAGGIEQIVLYETATGKKLRILDVSSFKANYAPDTSFSLDGKILTIFHLAAAPGDNHISRWETATGKMIGSWKTGADVPVAVSADDRLAASVRNKDHIIGIWDTASGKKIREWKATGNVFSASRFLIFSLDGRNIVAAGEDGVIRVYETTSGKEVRSWKGRTQSEKPCERYRAVAGWLAFAPDGKTLASVDCDDVLHLWDWKTGGELRRFDGVYGPFAFSADGKILAAGGKDFRIRLWDATTGRDLCPFDDPGGVTQVAFRPDGQELAVASDRGLSRLVDARDGRELKLLTGYRLLAFSPDGGSLLALQQDGVRLGPLCVLDADTGKERSRLQDAKSSDLLGGWSEDGKFLTTTEDHHRLPVRVWDAATGKKLREIQGISNAGYVRCSPDARTVAIADDKGALIRLFATETGKELRQLTGYGERVDYAANRESRGIGSNTYFVPKFAPNGKALLAGCEEQSQNAFGLWDVASGKRTRRWSCRELLPIGPKFSPDGKWLCLPDNRGDPCLVDMATGRICHRLAQKGGDLHFLLHPDNRAFSTDGRLLAAAYDSQSFVLWETATGQPIRQWKAPMDRPIDTGELHRRYSERLQIVFSPDSRRLATVSDAGTALVWDVTGLSPNGHLPGRKLTPAERKQKWNDLADADAAIAHEAIWSLVADPEQALALLHERLPPKPRVDPRRLAGLLANLDSDTFTVRETATQELRKLGERAEPALRKALNGNPSAELRRRVQGLLKELDSAGRSAESLRSLRAVAVLEYIANAGARQWLGVLAEGAIGAERTQEAKTSLARLRSRRLQP